MDPGRGEPVIRIEQLTKQFGEFTALDGLSLCVDRGQILGLIGHNGAGKSTTIRILVGQSRPTSGTAAISGIDCASEFKKIKRLVGYMPDVFGTYEHMRVYEYLDFFGAAFGIERRQRKGRLADVMRLAGVEAWKDLFVESLSHGMKQRVAVARTLIHDPKVLILDEPVNGLDPQARIEMRILLRQLADQGKTLIVSSHILPELSRICDVVAILARGQLKAFGTVDQIMTQLHQRRLFEIQLVAAEHLPAGREVVAAHLGGAADVSVSEQERVVRFYTAQTDADNSRLIAELVRRGVEVSQFREVAADLEAAFMEITEQHSQSESTPQSPRDTPCEA